MGVNAHAQLINTCLPMHSGTRQTPIHTRIPSSFIWPTDTAYCFCLQSMFRGSSSTSTKVHWLIVSMISVQTTVVRRRCPKYKHMCIYCELQITVNKIIYMYALRCLIYNIRALYGFLHWRSCTCIVISDYHVCPFLHCVSHAQLLFSCTSLLSLTLVRMRREGYCTWFVCVCVCVCVCTRLCVRPQFFSKIVAAMVVKRGHLST